jgi:hypothetical protein
VTPQHQEIGWKTALFHVSIYVSISQIREGKTGWI